MGVKTEYAGPIKQARREQHAEVDALWVKTAIREPGFADVAKLRYVRAALDEALRLWPTAPAYLRAARTDTMPGGLDTGCNKTTGRWFRRYCTATRAWLIPIV